MTQEQHGRISRRTFAGLLALAPVAFTATSASAAPATLRGTVAYRERMALPPTATVEVRLIDVSRADAPSRTIAETSVRSGRQVPIAFTLRYNDRDIRQNRVYALRAEIRDGERLLFTTTQTYRVLTGGRDNTNLMLERVAGPSRPEPRPDPSAALVGRWVVTEMRGEPMRGGRQPTLELMKSGQISGNAGCNGIGGEAKIGRQGIRFEGLIGTQMACSPQIMRRERNFISALENTRNYRFEGRNRQLHLLDQRGSVIMKLRSA